MKVEKSKIQNCIIARDVRIIEPVNLYGCSISDSVFIGPFVEIQKGVKIGKRSKIQSHSFICELVEIGNDCFISMGSSVNKKLKNESFVINSKSTIYDKDHKISKFIKKNYFYDV